MRWQVVVPVCVVLTYSFFLALQEYRLFQAEAEVGRLTRDLAEANGLLQEARTPPAPPPAEVMERWRPGALDQQPPGRVRGPYPDGMSDERLDPWRPGTRQPVDFGIHGNGTWAVTGNPPACAAGPLVPGHPVTANPPAGRGIKSLYGDDATVREISKRLAEAAREVPPMPGRPVAEEPANASEGERKPKKPRRPR